MGKQKVRRAAVATYLADRGRKACQGRRESRPVTEKGESLSKQMNNP